jgi:uncharacterized membrane protein YfcA
MAAALALRLVSADVESGPMSATNLLLSTASGALIVISGGLYALLLALGRLRRSRAMRLGAAAAYAAMAGFVFLLAAQLSLYRAWYLVVLVVLAGYLLAPKAIWHLTEATHRSEHTEG